MTSTLGLRGDAMTDKHFSPVYVNLYHVNQVPCHAGLPGIDPRERPFASHLPDDSSPKRPRTKSGRILVELVRKARPVSEGRSFTIS